MPKPTQVQRLMFLFAVAGLAAVTADFACLEDVCAPNQSSGLYTTMDDVKKQQIATLADELRRAGIELDSAQRAQLGKNGELLGAIKPLTHPIKHPNGTVEMPANWLPAIPDGHPWRSTLTPADDAFYSWFQERILKARLWDPSNEQHREWADAYLRKGTFAGWTYAGGRTECAKKQYDAAIKRDAEPDAEP
jgi:hypothetical protein